MWDKIEYAKEASTPDRTYASPSGFNVCALP
jgi:hypothetical protein